MDRVWGYAAAVDTGTVTVHVRRLRAKIERDPSRPAHLQTVWGVGYRLVP
jgi:DNA-binding response OmpR family regulator